MRVFSHSDKTARMKIPQMGTYGEINKFYFLSDAVIILLWPKNQSYLNSSSKCK